jgi:hypothetical protein
MDRGVPARAARASMGPTSVLLEDVLLQGSSEHCPHDLVCFRDEP